MILKDMAYTHVLVRTSMYTCSQKPGTHTRTYVHITTNLHAQRPGQHAHTHTHADMNAHQAHTTAHQHTSTCKARRGGRKGSEGQLGGPFRLCVQIPPSFHRICNRTTKLRHALSLHTTTHAHRHRASRYVPGLTHGVWCSRSGLCVGGWLLRGGEEGALAGGGVLGSG